MNTKNITTWIAQHKGKAALLALAFIIFAWDWFAIPRLIIMILLPLVVLAIPVIFIAAVPVGIWLFLKRRRAQQVAPPFNPNMPPAPPASEYPEAAPRRLSTAELQDMYERFPERFEGVDFGDDIDRH